MDEAGYRNCVSVPDGAPPKVSSKIPDRDQVRNYFLVLLKVNLYRQPIFAYLAVSDSSLIICNLTSAYVLCKARIRSINICGTAKTILTRWEFSSEFNHL